MNNCLHCKVGINENLSLCSKCVMFAVSQNYGSGPTIMKPYKDEKNVCEFPYISHINNSGIDNTSYTNREEDWFISGPDYNAQIHCTEEIIKNFINVSGVLRRCPDEIVNSKRTVMFKVHNKKTRDSMYMTNGVPEVKSQEDFESPLPKVSGDLETGMFGGVNWEAKQIYDNNPNKSMKDKIKAMFFCYE